VTIQRKLFWVFDFLCMLLAFLVAGWAAPALHRQLTFGGLLYGRWIESFSPSESAAAFAPLYQYLWVFFIVAPVALISIDLLGGHLPIRQQRAVRILLVSVAAPISGMALLSTVFFVLKSVSGYSRVFVFCFVGGSCVVICASRVIGRAWHGFILRQGMHVQRVAVVGETSAIRIVASRLREKAAPLEYELAGYLSVPSEAVPVEAEPGCQLPCLGGVDELGEVLVHQPIQQIIMVLPGGRSDWLDEAVRACDYFRVTTHIVPQSLLTARFQDLVPATRCPVPALTLTPSDNGSEWLAIKRVVDVCISGASLIILSPVFLLIAIAIKLSSPHLPVFYPWRVIGNRGRRFTGYKFTTMNADADPKRSQLQLASRNEMNGPVFKIARDPRVTPLGRFLRKYSLNELPQLWSVLKGDMSLVGPRPAAPHELERYELWHKRKLSVQPGITCFWQVRGRNRINSFDDWVNLDLEYIGTRSPWVDCKILAKTAWVVLRGTGS
jgi:exopolysaccharide biosynthesis polyprenyl glycosylphosphotransferase